MNKQLLYSHLKKVNMSAKDRAEFIKSLDGGNGSGDLYQRVSQIELSLSNVLEVLKPVQLSGFPPIGNVTQEQLDDIGLTEKVINNILNGYVNKICIENSIYNVMDAYINPDYVRFIFVRIEFYEQGISSFTQYEYSKISNEITITIKEM